MTKRERTIAAIMHEVETLTPEQWHRFMGLLTRLDNGESAEKLIKEARSHAKK